MIQIGRCGGDISFDRGPASATWRGDRLSLSGHMQASSEANQKVLRQQLLGHADNPDEPVIPVVWPYDTDVTGFYRPLSVGVELFQRPTSVIAFDVELERVPGYQAPLFELWSRGTLRVNAHSITTSNATPWVGLPSTVTDLKLPVTTSAPGRARVLAGDSVTMYYLDGGIGASQTSYYDTEVGFYLPPANYYDGAVTLTTDGNVVVGEQVLNDPSDWVVGNGLVEVEWTSSGVFTVSVYDGSAWRSKGYKIGIGGVLSTTDPTNLTVLRNSPEAVSIRVGGVPQGSLPSAITSGGDSVSSITRYIDITVRRGGRYAEFTAVSATAEEWWVSRSATEAGTSTTAGVRASSTDANGDRYVIASPLTLTAETTDGGIIYGDGSFGNGPYIDTFPFMIGLDTGTDGVLPNPDPATTDVFSVAGLVNQYHAATAIRQNIAVR